MNDLYERRKCPQCDGSGRVRVGDPGIACEPQFETCQVCNGTGTVNDGGNVRDIVCSQCLGEGSVKRFKPHIADPEFVQCPQCQGKKTIRVFVPSDQAEDSRP